MMHVDAQILGSDLVDSRCLGGVDWELRRLIYACAPIVTHRPHNVRCIFFCVCQAMKIEVHFADQRMELEVFEDTCLGAVQRILCRHFQQRFPFSKASLTIENETYDEFIQEPFRTCRDGAVVHVCFDDTDDPLFYDLLDRNPNHKWLQ